MHYAIIGCIHGNYPALVATMDDIKARGIERVVCLGDIVGFGPDPLECIDLVRQRCFMVIRGDHDEGVIAEKPEGFIGKTARGLAWTRRKLLEEGPDQLAWLAESTQAAFASAGIAFHHGSPRSPFEYLFPSDVRRDPRKLRAAFAMTEKVCFHAHTHVPGVITEDMKWRTADDLEGHFHYAKGQKALVSVGSVGQPRDGDPRACYLEIKKNDMFWRRVEYDVAAAVGRIQSVPDAFGPDLAIRLQQGR